MRGDVPSVLEIWEGVKETDIVGFIWREEEGGVVKASPKDKDQKVEETCPYPRRQTRSSL